MKPEKRVLAPTLPRKVFWVSLRHTNIIIIGLLKIKHSSQKAELCLGLQYKKNSSNIKKRANIQ